MNNINTQSAEIEAAIERILHAKFEHILEDISFRISQAYEVVGRVNSGVGKVFAEDLNLIGRHLLTGYAVTNNSPAAGSISWSDLHIVYSGVDNIISNGNTALKFVWWSPSVTPLVLQYSNVKPSLAAGEVLLFTNIGGAAKVMLSDTNASLPAVLADGSVDASSIIANAVTNISLADNAVLGNNINNNAVTSTKISDGSITRATQLTNNVVTSTAIAASAVSASKLSILRHLLY